MAKQLNIDLRVSADIKQAKANFESLQKTLFKLQESTRIDVKDESLSKAQKAAGDLARNLQQATNVNTGKLDLNKFSQSLNKSGQDLKKLHQQLTSLGPEGEQAFFKLTQSVATADASTLNLGKKISALGTVLKNTARWQLSSSLLHGFMGAISGAYRYAQDLNESLNNIRIVTGQNIDQMSKFAKEANNAARALSTTTTQYTDASLIYYQQGLSDEEVKSRTDATIKLANVSRQSAEEVSNQMTAIWNNFAKGDTNLEYYADVVTALGAATASSSEEIAEGLSKFASIADTVGLSYEKSSAALATVTAETRQSADVVGTAFRTMFARIQGLNLGETLEDGVDLNKYSQALKVVGVNVLDSNNQLKNMDTILDELGEKWNSISEAQKVALSETVAGVRQYSQFMALMNNYDKIQQNQNLAENSGGTLQEQADVYAESWEAARDRVTAALETIYKQLLNDNFFIDMLNSAEKFLDFISNVIDGLGGVKGILLLISSIFMQYYAKEMPRVLQSLRDNISVITGASQRRAQVLLDEAREELELNAAMEKRNRQTAAVATTASVTAKMTEVLNKARKELSQTEIEAYEYEIKLAGAIGKTTEELGKEIDQLEKKGKATADQLTRQINRDDNEENRINRLSANEQIEESYNYEQAKKDNEKRIKEKAAIELHKKDIQNRMLQKQEKLTNDDLTDGQKKSLNMNIARNETSIANDNARLEEIEKENVLFEEMTKKHQKFIQYSKMSGKELFQEMEKLSKASGKRNLILDEMGSKQQEWKDNFNKISKNGSSDFSSLIKEIEKYKQKLEEAGVSTKELDNALNEIGKGNISGIDKIFNALNAAIDENNIDLELLQSQLKLLGVSDKDINELIIIWERAGAGAEEFKAKLEEIKNKMGELPQHEIKISEGLAQMASAAMQVSMVINGFQNIGRIFSDEDLSTGEKIIQTMTAVGSMLPMIIALTNKQRIVEMGAVAAKILHIGATNADAAAETASIGAKIASGTAGWYALGPLLLFVTIAAAVVAAIFLIANALIDLANTESKETKAAKEANAELEAAKKAATEAKQAYEDLKNAVSDYESAIKTLEQCTKGTLEWRDAFQEVLDKTFQLIDTYPQLLKYTNLYNTNGSLNIDALNKAVEDAQSLSNTANIIQIQAQNKKTLADEDLKKAEFGEARGDDLLLQNYYSNSVQYTTTEKGVYPTDTPRKENHYDLQTSTITAMAKDVSKQLLEDNDLTTSFKQASTEEEQKEVLRQAIINKELLKNYNLTNDSLNRATNEIVDSIMQVKSDFLSLSDESEQTSLSLKNASKIINESFFGEDFSKKTTAEQVGYSQALGQKTQEVKAKSNAAEEYAEKYHWQDANYDTLKTGASGKTEDEQETGKYIAIAIENYANKHNLEINKKDTISPGKNDDDRLVSFEDKANNYEEKKIDLKDVLAEQQALDLENARNEIIANGKIMAEKYQNMNQGLISYLNNQDFNEATVKDLKQLNNNSLDTVFGVDEDGNIDIEKVRTFLAAANNVNPEDINDEKVQTFIDNFSTGMTDAVNQATDIIPSTISSKIKTGLVDSLKIGDIAKVGQMYEKAIVSGGEAGVNTLNSLADLAGDEADEVMGALANMDLTEKSTKDVNKALSDLGIGFQLTETQVASLKNALVETGKITAEVAQETYKNTSKILSSLKETGDTIEAQDYEELLKINPALSSYFTLMADGTYMLTGAAQDFKTAAQTAQVAQLEMARQAAADTANAYQMLQKSGAHSKEDMGDNPTWDTYEEETRAKINILADAGNDEVKAKATEYQAMLEAGVNDTTELNKIVSDVATAYDKLNLSAENFDNLTQEAAKKAEELSEAIKEANYQNEINNVGLDYNTTENYANVLMEAYEAQGLSKEAARELAIANQRLDRGLTSLNDNLENWTKSLDNNSESTAEYAQTIGEVRKAFADLLNIADADELSLEWIESWIRNADELALVMDGDTEAIQRFRESAFAEMTTNVFSDMKNSLKEMLKDVDDMTDKDWAKDMQSLFDVLDSGKFSAENLRTAIVDLGNTEVGGGATLSDDYINSLNQMLANGLLTEQQLNDIFASIGYKPKVITDHVDQWTEIPVYETHEGFTGIQFEDMGNGISVPTWTKRTYTKQVATKRMKQSIPVTQIVSEDAEGGNLEVINAGSTNITPSYSSTTSGGDSGNSKSADSSSKKNTSAASHNHEVNRYSNEENAINGLSKQYDRLSKAKDKAFGKSRIQALEQELQALKELKKASSNYLDAIVGSGNGSKVAQGIQQGKSVGSMIAGGQLGGTVAADYRSLFNGADASGKQVEYTAKDSDGNEWLASSGFSLGTFNSMFGTNLSFNLDSFGNIQNRDSILNLLQNLRNSENDAYSRIADPSAGSTTEYNKRIAYLDAIKERIEQYGETVETLGDKVEEYLDYISEIQEKNAEIISAKLETGVDLGQKTVQRLERAIKVLGDNIYKTAEGMSKWYDMTFKQGINANKEQGNAYLQAMKETSDKLNLYSQPGGEFNESAIDPAHAAELLSQIEDGLDGLIDDVLEKIEQGKEFFGNTLDYWNEKLNRVNTAIENNNKILSHFQNVLNLLGKSADYDALGQILQGISDNAKEDYAQRSRQFEDARQIYNSAYLYQTQLERMGITGEALEQQKEIVAQALEDYQNKYDAMFSSAEAYLESLNNITQNNINRIFAAAEDSLSGEWGSLDALDSAMQRHQSVADQYLTKTNQIYETNKLLRQIQQDIDKTDSKIAKDKLKNFSLEIDALKQREKLSKSSLEIAKAQYEMLQAQIALEEAQNAKTTVRLQRDNEGNYGYVYTADQEQVNDAEQNYADKENEYYNTLYRIQEEAGQRNIELRKEFLAELQSLQEAFYVNGTISEEEYNKQLADLKDTYRALEQVNQADFLEASTLLNDVAAQGQTETWISSFDDIITKHRLFNDESATELDNYNTNTQSTADELTDKITNCLQEANAERERVEQETKMGNKDLQRSINEVTSSTKQLSDSVTKRGGLADSMNIAMNKALNLSAAFAQQYDSLQQLVNKYRNAADEVNTLYSRTVDLINAQVALNHANNGATSVSWKTGSSNVYSSNSSGSGSDSGGSSYDPVDIGDNPPPKNNYYAPWTYMWYDPETGRHTLIQKATGREFHVLPKDLYKYGFKSGGYTGTWTSGKTGMYTGSWNGPDVEENGKLAFLHQKELVLNAEDTENILDAVKLIRQISQSIDLQAISQASGWQLAAAQYSGSNEPLQQDITIHAEFPNAVDHNEIEQAFDNLANKAAQFANRS